MATIGQGDRIIELLKELSIGASQGLFGNAIFFDEQPVTAKPNDVSIDTVNGIIYQYDGTTWNQQLDLQNEITANNGLIKTDTLIQLGGLLIKDTTIDASTFLFDLIGVNNLQFNLTPTTTHTEGQLHWNDDDKTLNIDTEVNGTSIQVGQESVVRVTNKTGVVIPNGSVVYINGAQGNRPTVALADADSGLTTDATIGVVTADIANNGTGYATDFGLVRDLNTSAFTEGDILYISSTAGELTNVEPISPAHRVRVGICLISNPASGVIFVEVINGEHLYQLHDVLISNPQENERLSYRSSDQLWVENQLGVIDELADKSYVIPSNSQLLIDEGINIEGNLEIEGRLFIE